MCGRASETESVVEWATDRSPWGSTVADLLMYGSGWTQRWSIRDGHESEVRNKILETGKSTTGLLAVVDPNTGADVTMVINWHLVAVALVLDGNQTESGGGNYA